MLVKVDISSSSHSSKIKPKALREGATIGVVCPSYWLDEATLEKGVQFLEQQGYAIKLGKSVITYPTIVAGDPEIRADDINAMFADPEVDAIICARGGYGGNRVLPLLDYDLIQSSQKIFMGFSDVTGLLNSITTNTGLITFHGPMIASFGRHPNDFTFTHMQQILSGQSPQEISAPTDDNNSQVKPLKLGQATGELCGGNLCLMVERLGTDNQIDTSEKILLLEDVGEKIYALDRMLLHMKNCGSLDNLKGIIVGEMCEISDTDVPFGQTVDEIILAVCAEYDYPIISNFPAGHGEYIATLPIGHEVTLVSEPESASVQFDEPAVS